jgi:hypothetical protein
MSYFRERARARARARKGMLEIFGCDRKLNTENTEDTEKKN